MTSSNNGSNSPFGGISQSDPLAAVSANRAATAQMNTFEGLLEAHKRNGALQSALEMTGGGTRTGAFTKAPGGIFDTPQQAYDVASFYFPGGGFGQMPQPMQQQFYDAGIPAQIQGLLPRGLPSGTQRYGANSVSNIIGGRQQFAGGFFNPGAPIGQQSLVSQGGMQQVGAQAFLFDGPEKGLGGAGVSAGVSAGAGAGSSNKELTSAIKELVSALKQASGGSPLSAGAVASPATSAGAGAIRSPHSTLPYGAVAPTLGAGAIRSPHSTLPYGTPPPQFPFTAPMLPAAPTTLGPASTGTMRPGIPQYSHLAFGDNVFSNAPQAAQASRVNVPTSNPLFQAPVTPSSYTVTPAPAPAPTPLTNQQNFQQWLANPAQGSNKYPNFVNRIHSGGPSGPGGTGGPGGPSGGGGFYERFSQNPIVRGMTGGLMRRDDLLAERAGVAGGRALVGIGRRFMGRGVGVDLLSELKQQEGFSRGFEALPLYHKGVSEIASTELPQLQRRAMGGTDSTVPWDLADMTGMGVPQAARLATAFRSQSGFQATSGAIAQRMVQGHDPLAYASNLGDLFFSGVPDLQKTGHLELGAATQNLGLRGSLAMRGQRFFIQEGLSERTRNRGISRAAVTSQILGYGDGDPRRGAAIRQRGLAPSQTASRMASAGFEGVASTILFSQALATHKGDRTAAARELEAMAPHTALKRLGEAGLSEDTAGLAFLADSQATTRDLTRIRRGPQKIEGHRDVADIEGVTKQHLAVSRERQKRQTARMSSVGDMGMGALEKIEGAERQVQALHLERLKASVDETGKNTTSIKNLTTAIRELMKKQDALIQQAVKAQLELRAKSNNSWTQSAIDMAAGAILGAVGAK